MSRNTIYIATVLATVVFTPLAGCGRAESQEEHAQRVNGERLAKIAKASGGDWDKLSDDDRQFLVNDIAHGSEQTARMLILPRDQMKKQLRGLARR